MAYIQHKSWRDRPGAVAAVIAIHGLVGYALVTGLSFQKIMDTVKNPQGINVEVPLDPPPPPPKPERQVEPDTDLVSPPVHAPTPQLDLAPVRPLIDTTPIIIPQPEVPYVAPRPTPSATPARPAFDPVAAKPRNNPASWVTVDDYRSSWINRGWTGLARFRLDVGANGKVQGCTITASSGHAELDQATCALISRRARFEPAKDAMGTKIDGSYSSSVRWVLPE